MSQKILGVDLFRVTTTPIAELGLEVEEVRGGEGIITFQEVLPTASATGGLSTVTTTRRFDPAGMYKYIRANATIIEGNAVQIDIAFTPEGSRHANVVHTAALDQVIEGIALVTIPAGSFGYVQIKGKHYAANVLDVVADGARLTTSAVAGQLADIGAVTALTAATVAVGRRVMKIADATTQGGLVNRGLVVIKE